MKNYCKQREETKEYLKREQFDVLIIGGGITGAGIALDAVTRGLKVALIEMNDFASGTSSRSTKLIHGGLRYLKQGEVALVAEVGTERSVVYENAPHVTEPIRMLLPIYRNGAYGWFPKFKIQTALTVYDRLAQVEKRERKRMISKEEVLKRLPQINSKSLIGCGEYVEYRTDDARLTIEVIKKANEYGVASINYMRATNFQWRNDSVQGAWVCDELTKETFLISAKMVVNATGVWVKEVQNLARDGMGKSLFVTKGVHIVFNKKVLPLNEAIYFDHNDGRMIFIVPRGEDVYVGTTDTVYNEDLERPSVKDEDIQYLLQAIQTIFPSYNLQRSDVTGYWSGLRPLIKEEGKNASEISRKDEIWNTSKGFMTIAGGKLTGYRKMAEDVVDIILAELYGLDVPFVPSVTKTLPLSGGDVGGGRGFIEYKQHWIQRGIEEGLAENDVQKLVNKYGSNILYFLEKSDKIKELSVQYNIPIEVVASCLYAFEEEYCIFLDDFLVRRTDLMYFHLYDAKRYYAPLLRLLKKELQWSIEMIEQNKKRMNIYLEK